MKLENTPRIVANKNNNANVFVKAEKTFNTKQELQAYLVDSLSKNKRKSFNMNVVLN
jgi:hypothetical protein